MLPIFNDHSEWKKLLRTNFTRWEALADFLELTEQQKAQILSRPKFTLNLPFRLAQKIAKGNLEDPILKQFLPTIKEAQSAQGFVADPVGDSSCKRSSKLLHKYEGRILLVCTSACAMHCRYCFRQNFDYETNVKGYREELNIIAHDPSIHEVILSGGDPLSLSDDILEDLICTFNDMPHIRRLRIHTRFPIGIPERIDEGFIKIIQNCRPQVFVVLHVNHPRELDEEVVGHLKLLRQVGAVLLNQAVLLKGVNDNLPTLKTLSESLVDAGITPYYLHQLDRVNGAAHFEVPEEEGIALIKQLGECLSGYAVPKYVREVPGAASKSIII